MAITENDIELIRVYLGDTDASKYLVSDDSIILLWTKIEETETPNHKLVAADLALGLAAKFSRSVSFSVEGLSISSSQKAEAFRKLAKELRESAGADDVTNAGAALNPGDPFVSGVSHGEMDAVTSDDDRFGSAFEVGMHDNPGADDGSVH